MRDGVMDGVVVTDGDAVDVGVDVSVGVRDGDDETVADGDRVPVGDGDEVTVGVAVVVGDGDGVGDGVPDTHAPSPTLTDTRSTASDKSTAPLSDDTTSTVTSLPT